VSIVLTRIDNRLIHGQVMEAWVPFVQADCIVVANDDAAMSPLKKAMMEACVPRSMKIVVGTIGDIAQRMQGEELSSSRVLLLLENAHDALDLYRAGVQFAQLNLGNMHASQGKVAVSCTLCIDGEDVERLRDLEAEGVKISARCIPQDTEQSWHKLRQCWEKSGRD